jgi:hypothetical protein
MQPILSGFSTASSHAATIWKAVSAKENTNHVVRFWIQHGAAISDIALIAGDFYCLWEAPVTLFTSFTVTTSVTNNFLNNAAAKIIQIWQQQPSLKPLISGGAVIFSAWQPQRALAVVCGFYSSNRLKSILF